MTEFESKSKACQIRTQIERLKEQKMKTLEKCAMYQSDILLDFYDQWSSLRSLKPQKDHYETIETITTTLKDVRYSHMYFFQQLRCLDDEISKLEEELIPYQRMEIRPYVEYKLSLLRKKDRNESRNLQH